MLTEAKQVRSVSDEPESTYTVKMDNLFLSLA